MRGQWIAWLMAGLAFAVSAADENTAVSRFERAALTRESAAESYRLEAEKLAQDSDFFANSLAPSATNFQQRIYYVDSAGVKYERAGDLMVLARRQYMMALTNWSHAEREYRLQEEGEIKAARAAVKTDENRMEAYRCAGMAADYYEAGAEHYGDVDKFEKQGACFTKASMVLEEVAKERARPIRKKVDPPPVPVPAGGGGR